MPWRSPSRWMSEIPGQSGHALPNPLSPSCAKSRRGDLPKFRGVLVV
jgi:hypothetical protein